MKIFTKNDKNKKGGYFKEKYQRKVNLTSDTMNYGLTKCKQCPVIEENQFQTLLTEG